MTNQPDPETPTIPRITELVNKYVENLGEDYKYPYESCKYQIDGQPACIIGHVLADMNVPMDRFRGLNNEYGIDYLFKSALDDISVDDETVSFMESLQYLQDRKVPWKIALEKAQQVYRLPGEVRMRLMQEWCEANKYWITDYGF